MSEVLKYPVVTNDGLKIFIFSCISTPKVIFA